MIVIFFILFFVNFGDTAYKDCNDSRPYTETYLKYLNKFSELYQTNTFGGTLNLVDKCTDLGVKENARNTYINILKKNGIKCSGKWCIDGEYKCLNDNRTCYEIEHIVDKNNTPYDN